MSAFVPRLAKRKANADAVEILTELLDDARAGKLVSLAWGADYGHEQRTGFTSTDDNMTLAGVISRLQHQIQLAIDAEYGPP